MVLDNMRSRADFAILPIAKICRNTNPNTISWIGLLLAFISGTFFAVSHDHHIFLIFGAILVITSGYFDSLDGKVAKLFNKCTKKGDYLDHIFDRYADMFMIGGIAISGWCNNSCLGITAIIGTLLTSYMGTQAQAVGASRLYTGLLGRADRIVLSTLFPILQYAFSLIANGKFSSFNISIGEVLFNITWLEIMLLWFAIVGNITAIQRAIVIWNSIPE
ncbi:MAG: CDP-alcohol phosphatidyltransferase family protein [archaeon]|nr:CDP-alcohol phosphatidyltransferase family protein [archaeon]